jgi:hypothetical protein
MSCQFHPAKPTRSIVHTWEVRSSCENCFGPTTAEELLPWVSEVRRYEVETGLNIPGYSTLKALVEASTEWIWTARCKRKMMTVTAATRIVYPLHSNTGVQDDDGKEEGPEIHLIGWTGSIALPLEVASSAFLFRLALLSPWHKAPSPDIGSKFLPRIGAAAASLCPPTETVGTE